VIERRRRNGLILERSWTLEDWLYWRSLALGIESRELRDRM